MQYQRFVVSIVLVNLLGAPVAWAAKVDVDWGAPTGIQATSAKYGLNLFQVYNPAVSQQKPAYKRELSRMAPGYMRVHSWNMMRDSSSGDGWVRDGDKATYKWDEDKIVAALNGILQGSTLGMINIPAWPAFLGSSDKALDPAKHAAFAAFCAQLVQVINVKGKYGIRYWEVTNERDDLYKGNGAALGALVLEAARAMKKVDPTIKVGGAAFITAYNPVVGEFLTATATELDFISYHSYSTGDGNAPLQGLFDSAAGLGSVAGYMRAEIAKRTTRKIEVFHNEYNISWAPPDARMNTVEGAVFDALALVGFAKADITGSAAWNEADGWYGKLDGDLKPRPASYVFELFNHFALGDVVKTNSDAEKNVVPLAIKGKSGNSLFLVNRTPDATSVDVGGFGLRKAQASQVTKDGLATVTLPTSGSVTLPALSVTLLVSGNGATGAEAGSGGGAGQGGGGGTTAGGTGGTSTGGTGGVVQGGAGGMASGEASQGVGGSGAPTAGGASGRSGAGGSVGDRGGAASESDSASTGSGCSYSQQGSGSRFGLAWLAFGLAFSLRRRSPKRRSSDLKTFGKR